MKHLGLCVASGDHVTSEFAFAFAGLVQHISIDPPPGLGALSISNMRGSMLCHQRYRLALEAMEKGATHMLWIDTDMLFPTTAAHRLLSHGKPIVAVNYRKRRAPFDFCSKREPGKPLETTPDTEGLEPAYRVGFGMILIETSVFRAIPKPYFDMPWDPEQRVYLGEDYYFCDAAREAGFPIHVDHDLSKQVAHVAVYGITALSEP